MQLPGCLAAFDDLIKDFLNKTVEERDKVIAAGDALLFSGTVAVEQDENSART